MRLLTRDKSFYSETLKIALPISLQFLLANLLNMADTLMVGRLGEPQLAGVMAGNNIYFVFSLFIIGVASGAGIFSAQYYGSGNHDGIRKITGLSLTLSGMIAVLFTIIIAVFPDWVTGIFTTDPEVAGFAKEYILIILLSYLPAAATECYFGVLKSTGQVKIPLYSSIIALSIDTALTYLLIYGKFGFPEMGVTGVAVATVIARYIQIVLMIALVYKDKHIIACGVKKIFYFSTGLLNEFLRVSMPVVVNEALWGLGTTCYNIVYGRMGMMELAVSAIVGNIERIFTFLFMGMGYAALALLGKKIGEKREDLAYEYAVSYIWLTVIIGVAVSVLLAVFSPLLLDFYNVLQETKDTAFKVLMVLAFFITVRTVNFVNIVGILRSGGDTKTTAVIDLTAIWLIGVPLAFAGGIFLGLPMPVVYLMINIEEIYKLTMGLWRLRSKKWIKSLEGAIC